MSESKDAEARIRRTRAAWRRPESRIVKEPERRLLQAFLNRTVADLQELMEAVRRGREIVWWTRDEHAEVSLADVALELNISPDDLRDMLFKPLQADVYRLICDREKDE